MNEQEVRHMAILLGCADLLALLKGAKAQGVISAERFAGYNVILKELVEAYALMHKLDEVPTPPSSSMN